MNNIKIKTWHPGHNELKHDGEIGEYEDVFYLCTHTEPSRELIKKALSQPFENELTPLEKVYIKK